MRGYAICTAPRSGSNFLSQLLASTGVLGRPLEYFNGAGRRYFDDPAYPDDPVLQIERILVMGATPNGVYGLKIFAHQHDWIVDSIRWAELLPELRFVFLKRGDLLAQAISWVRAEQTGQYRHSQPARAEPSFDTDKIAASLTSIATEYARWELFFARNGIGPVRLFYEDVVRAPQAAVDRVADLFDLMGAAQVDADRVSVRVQRDALAEEWHRRFVAERGDPNFVDRLWAAAPAHEHEAQFSSGSRRSSAWR